MQVIPFDIAYLDQLVNLFDEYRVFYKKQSDKQAAKNFLQMLYEQKSSTVFMALNNTGIVVGFVQLYPLFSSTRMQPLLLLNDLFVNEHYRGKGVSKLLIDAAKNYCQRSACCALILETQKTNTVANKLYIESGFTLDTEHNYYEWSA